MASEPPVALYVNCIPSLDWLVALEYGRVDEGQPLECWSGVTDDLGFLRERPVGRVVGFKLLRFREFDSAAPENAAAWEPPLFDVPALGLLGVPAAEVIVQAREVFAERGTYNRALFELAAARAGRAGTDRDAAPSWLACLEVGDAMAHYGFGVSLYDQGRAPGAYFHLRYYAEIAPRKAWAHYWMGRAALAQGLAERAAEAFERAIELETDDELMNLARVALLRLQSGEPDEGDG